MADLAKRMTIITLTMAVFAVAFSHLVIHSEPMRRTASSGLVASCAPTGLNTCRPTF